MLLLRAGVLLLLLLLLLLHMMMLLLLHLLHLLHLVLLIQVRADGLELHHDHLLLLHIVHRWIHRHVGILRLKLLIILQILHVGRVRRILLLLLSAGRGGGAVRRSGGARRWRLNSAHAHKSRSRRNTPAIPQ